MIESTAPVQGKRKTKVGRVVSDKMDKTIVVSVERLTRHRLYKRVIRLTTKFKAHDETNDAHVGDTVLIEESRPLSRRSAGASSRSSSAPATTAARPSSSREEAAVSEAIHAAAHPGRTSTTPTRPRRRSGAEPRADAADDGDAAKDGDA